MRNYKFAKEVFDKIKPIRGTTTRPLAQRYDKTRTIIEKPNALSGQSSYAMRFYNTNCVEYFPDDSIIIRIDGYNSPMTAEFIDAYSPFNCYKRYNKVWVEVRDKNQLLNNVIPITHDLHLINDGNGGFTLANPKPILKEVIDKDKAKAAREPIKPFLNYVKAMLKISDGWIMRQTMMEAGAYSMHVNDNHVYDRLLIADEDSYLQWMCFISRNVSHLKAQWDTPNEGRNYRYSFESFKTRVYRLVDLGADTKKFIEVEVGNKAITGVQ